MEPVYGKKFAIVDPPEMSTIAYLLDENTSTVDVPKYTLQKLDSSTGIDNGRVKRTFFVNEEIGENDERDVVLLTVGKEKAVLNTGVLQFDKLYISKKPVPLTYKTLYSEQPMEYKNFKYAPNLKRPISIIDPETGEEVRPVLYFDAEENAVKGKIKLMPYKAYIALEVRDED